MKEVKVEFRLKDKPSLTVKGDSVLLDWSGGYLIIYTEKETVRVKDDNIETITERETNAGK